MVSIVIVNYNKKDLLRQCLDSVRSQSYKDIEIIVIDNGSTDNSVEVVKAYYPEVKLIASANNELFCRAYNKGIDESKADFILCLNNDCFLDKDYLKEALSAIRKDERIGMVSGKVLRPDKKTIDSTGLFLDRSRKPVERGYGNLDKGQYEKPGYVFGVTGAAAFLKREMLLDIKDEFGYFDERFGMYYEDLDLCWRAHRKGWKAYYTPLSIAYHYRAGTAAGNMKNKIAKIFPYLQLDLQKRYIINRYRCILKNDSLLGIIVNFPFIAWYEMKLWSYLCCRRLLRGLDIEKP